jgi:hypothetical protein
VPPRRHAIAFAVVAQLSFFSADCQQPVVADLGGLLAAHGQITTGPRGARLSILLDDRPRAAAVVAECARRAVAAEVVTVEGPEPQMLVRTDRCETLMPLAAAWTRGAVKSVPRELVITAGFTRLWVLAAGRTDDTGYLLGVDPHLPETVDDLIAACSRAGLAGSAVGSRAGGPAIRIVGHRRLARLADTVGTLPADLPPGCVPPDERRAVRDDVPPRAPRPMPLNPAQLELG